METLRAKVGDTFSLDCTRTDAGGDAVDLTGVTIRSQMRRAATAIDLTVSAVNLAEGRFALTASAADTADWVPGLYKCDVEFVDGSTVASTETFSVLLDEDVTRAA